MQTNISNRLNHLDAVRAIALILGIVFHASLSFMPFFIGWAVMDINTSNIAAMFILISHSFRLEVFFLIAGFFAHMSFKKMNKAKFIESRMLRIAVPFVLFWFVLKPFIDAGWMMGANSYNGDIKILSSLSIAFLNFEKLPEGIFVGSHLWFLYYLLLITLGMILIRSLFGIKKGLLTKIGERCDLILNILISKKMILILLLFPTVCCLWFMNHWGVDTPDKSLIPQTSVFVLYSLFFSLGWLLYRVPKLLIEFTRVTWVKIIFMVLSIIACVFLSSFESQYGHPNYLWFKAGYLISYAIMMWTLVLLLIGLCARLFSKPNLVVRYLSDASYWMYLIHLPIVVFLQVLIAELALFWWVKLLLIVTMTLIICLLSYDGFVRSTVIGKILNGKRKSRKLFKFNRGRGVVHERV